MRMTRVYHVHVWNCFDSTNALNSFTMLRVPTSRRSRLGTEGNVRLLAQYLVNDEDWPGIDEDSFTFVSDHELLAFDSYDEILYRFRYDGSFRDGRTFLKSRMNRRMVSQ
jgi:hypothetical protein